ncbi:MAG: hypothetical protein J2P21_08705 [Chloracidobacterium sp.]|nr:hypothetical protein [Chloracidobacterium sp.]
MALAQNNSEPAFTAAQLEALLDKAGELSDKYKTIFRDLTAEEKRVFELYDEKTGKIKRQRQTVSDLIVYASQDDPNRVNEYRNIREVDGKTVKNQYELVEKLLERVAAADSPDKEIDRIIHENSRYDFGDPRFIGYTLLNSLAISKHLRRSFKYEFAGRERAGEQELAVIKFEQTEVVENLFGRQYKNLNVTGPLMRGRYSLDPETGQLRREHNEIFYRDNAQPRMFKIAETDYDFIPGEQGVWLPQRILLQFFNPVKSDKKGFPIEMFLSVRVTHEFGPFRRFEIKAR